LPAGTNATFSIIDGTSGSTLLSCNSTQAQAGCNLTSISASSVHIKTTLATSTPGITPLLNWYNISWTPAYGNQVDLSVLAINFSTQSAVEGQLIQLSVNVSNIGSAASGNFTLELNISLFNGTYVLDQRLLQNLTSIGAGSSTLVAFNWSAKIGTYRFGAYADTYNNVSETSEVNNNYSMNYTTQSWHYQFGIYNYTVKLMGSSTFENWNVTNVSGYIYYSDADSSYSPTDLRPLNGTNYLSLADSALGMAYFNDSIVRLYDQNGDTWADTYRNMSIAGTYYMVPVINSTDSGTFVTGMLFDSGDGATYDGSQDLVFVTMLNASKQGRYGTYDYEVRLPVRLAKLKSGTDLLLRMDDVS
jgi:hypothetical protein